MRAFLPPLRGVRPWRAFRNRGMKSRDFGWFATGPDRSGNIRWGKRLGWLRAWVDTFRLAGKR
jgi:hypothetical protein